MLLREPVSQCDLLYLSKAAIEENKKAKAKSEKRRVSHSGTQIGFNSVTLMMKGMGVVVFIGVTSRLGLGTRIMVVHVILSFAWLQSLFCLHIIYSARVCGNH